MTICSATCARVRVRDDAAEAGETCAAEDNWPSCCHAWQCLWRAIFAQARRTGTLRIYLAAARDHATACEQHNSCCYYADAEGCDLRLFAPRRKPRQSCFLSENTPIGKWQRLSHCDRRSAAFIVTVGALWAFYRTPIAPQWSDIYYKCLPPWNQSSRPVASWNKIVAPGGIVDVE